MTTTWADDAVFGRVKRGVLASGGVNGIRAAVKAFRKMDTNADGALSPEELQVGVKQFGVTLTNDETRYLVKAFDRNKDGRVSVNEFIDELISSVPKRRKLLIRQLYAILRDRFPEMRGTDVSAAFDLSKHPAVEKGIATLQDIESEFSGAFSADADGDGFVSEEEWMGFCAGVSFTIPNDDVFETFLLRALDADNTERPKLEETQLKLGTMRAPYDVELDGTKVPFGNATAKTYNKDDLYREKYNRPVDPLPSVLPDYVTTMKRSFPHPTKEQTVASLPKKDAFTATGDPVLDSVRRKILKRVGEDGFVGLQRSFRIMDKSRDQKIDKEEFKNGLQRIRVELTPAEVATVFRKCDRSGDGHITVGELARTVRGPIRSQARIDILLEAFQRLDKSGDGIVALSEIAPRYDVSRHPAIIAGEKTKEEVVRDFIGDWDGNRDGKITAAEWMDYYANISCTIDDDQYFELMIRNAWHISGGKGAAQNTANLRVLVTHLDGTQSVETILDDLGLPDEKPETLAAALRKQGCTDILKVETATAI
uniref:EF-hand domain-containing protein n=1 Tax=Neobodo designis TaxID=312471 RepID=A0A7S1Q730_NEODS|mmetsp:Transcript_34984/g.107958  ORF Transcript_34984/g.107958 Transcript_34984/m.107958 type:complete len:539 (+) Transcript_34984:53-1669(+)